MIRVDELVKDYGSRRALHGISFHANKGEIIGFLGPNGAGKTTTMRILCGYMPPTHGRVTVAGFDIVDESIQVRRRVGYLPETVPLYPDMTVYSYLKYMADLRQLTDKEEKINRVLNSVHLQDRANGFISNLSKGMRQRVGLAQALIHEPDILILDEPTLGLDPVQIIEVRNLIKEIGKERTVLLSTHILSEAQQLCDRVLIINKGRIVVEDSPEHLQSRLTGSRRFKLRVSGKTDQLMDGLKSLPGVQDVHLVSSNEVEFGTFPGAEDRGDVARLVVSKNMDLLELSPINISLEDIFIELTRDDSTSPPEDSMDGGANNHSGEGKEDA